MRYLLSSQHFILLFWDYHRSIIIARKSLGTTKFNTTWAQHPRKSQQSSLYKNELNGNLACNTVLKTFWSLTHWGRVRQTNHHWFRQWIVAWSSSSHFLNQCWNIVNWALKNKLYWNLNRISHIFINEYAFENVVWKMAAILFRPECVKTKKRVLPIHIKVWGIILTLPYVRTLAQDAGISERDN